jgi:hypothetical protein
MKYLNQVMIPDMRDQKDGIMPKRAKRPDVTGGRPR